MKLSGSSSVSSKVHYLERPKALRWSGDSGGTSSAIVFHQVNSLPLSSPTVMSTLECTLGSMTGAPKKRSVEILQTLEDSDRSIYSGTFGYWCVSGAGDWAVTIRSCFKYDDGSGAADSDKEEWRIGAGGAITALSTVEGEWDEMHLKLQSVFRMFGVEPS